MLSLVRYVNWKRLLWTSRHFCREPRRCVYRPYSSCPAGMKVTICGAAGCTGDVYAEDSVINSL